MSINVTYPAEYPKIEVCGTNLKLARLLNNDLSSANSEMTAVHQYLFQSWLIQESYPQISRILLDISKVEMRHFHLLGRLIILLGGIPKYCSYQNGTAIPWNGRMVRYPIGIRQILTIDIAAEEHSCRIYREQARHIKDQKVAATLERMAQDEKLHCAILKKVLQDLSKENQNSKH